MIFLAGDLLAVMSPHHHHSSSRGRIARAGCRQTTRMQCGMRSDGLEANVTLHVASPERVDSLEIEDATAQNLRSAQTPLPPRTDVFGAILPQTHTCPSSRGAPPESQSHRRIHFLLYLVRSCQDTIHMRALNREDQRTPFHDSGLEDTALSAHESRSTVQAQKLIDAFVPFWQR